MKEDISEKQEVETPNGKKQKIIDIWERTFAFAVRIVKLCKFLEKKSDVSLSLINQLIRAGTSIGANLEEAVAGQSKSDFIHKNSISLKEARETNFWLRLILEISEFNEQITNGIKNLETESIEIAKIIGSIVVNSKK
jgi:four helix bundle protein